MRYRVNDSKIAWRVVDDEGVVLHAETSAYFGLNHTGTLLFAELAARAVTAADLADLLEERYPDAGPEAPAHVSGFLAELAQHDLLETVPDESRDAAPAAGAVNAPSNGSAYHPPALLLFGSLEKLILSAE